MADEGHESKSLEERVSFLEAQLKDLQNRLSGPPPPQQASPTPEAPTLRAAPQKTKDASPEISVIVGSKTFHKLNLLAGDVGDRIDFTFVFQSHLEKDVRAFKGVVVMKDLFDQEIMRLSLTHETGLPANRTADWKGGVQFNQFMAPHQRLLTIDQTDMTASFELESIIYTDGTRESFA